MSATLIQNLSQRFQIADDAWHREIRKAFPGQHPGDVRYTRAAKGIPGSPLYAAHEEFVAAGAAWREALYAGRE